MKKIFLTLFIFSVPIFAQKIDTVAVYSGNASLWSSHDSLVANSFVQGYESTSGNWNGIIIHSDYSLSQAYNAGAKLFIESYVGGFPVNIEKDQYYQYGLLQLYPAGSNTHTQVYNSGGNLPSAISTGAGDSTNETGYDVEFFSNDPTGNEPDLSSFSNGYIAGQLAFIKDSLNCTWWESRYRARITGTNNGSWNSENGYGKIQIDSALAYNGTIPSDPYLWHIGTIGNITSTVNDYQISLSWTAVTHATNYKLYCNGTEVYSGSSTSFLDTLTNGNYIYKYKAFYNGEESNYSTEDISIINVHLGSFASAPVHTQNNEHINVSWLAVGYASYYKIYRKLSTTEAWTYLDSTANNYYLDTTITRNRCAHNYKVIAFYNNEIAVSQTITVPFIKYEKFYFKKP